MKIPSILKKQTVSQAALLIACALFLSKFIGFARDILVAKYFGATGTTDAFMVALMIPITILGLFATGLNTLIIPVYIEKKAAGREAARRFANSVFLVAALFFILLTVLVVIFAPALVKVIAYGFKGERLTLAVTLTRYLALAGIFAVLTGLLTGILQAEKQFLAPAMAGLAGNTIIVISLFFLTGSLGINSWTVGQISGAVMAFSLLFFLLSRRYGFFRAFDLRGIDWKEISRFGYLLVPLVTASGVNLINTIVNKAIASGLDSGSISAIAFASRIWGLPVSLLAIPIATALFPTFSELAASDAGRAEYSAKLTKTLGVSWFFLIPSSVFLFFLSTPIVRMLFERGAFTPAATSLTSAVVRMYAIGLFAHIASPVLGNVFYSFKNTVTPLLISLATVALNIVLNIVLARLLGAPGIALATTIVMVLNFLIYSIFLKRYVPVLTGALGAESLKLVLASAPIAIVCLLSRPLFAGAGAGAASLRGFASLLLRLGAVGLVGTAVFLLGCLLLKARSFSFAGGYVGGLVGKFLKRGKA